MKKWMKISLAIVAVAIISSLAVYKFYINKPHKDIEHATPDFTLNSMKLYKEYTANKKHSDSLYNGKVIELSGKVDKIEVTDSMVIAVFVFSKGDFGDEGIRCTMLPKFNEDAKKIMPGTTVNVKGACSGFNDSDVILEKCSLIKD